MKLQYTISAVLLFATKSGPGAAALSNPRPPIARRNAIETAASSVSLSILGWLPPPGPSSAASTGPSPPTTVPRDRSVVVLGANGGTGRECVAAALASGRRCVATTRSGASEYVDGPAAADGRLTTAAADVTSPESLDAVLHGGGVGAAIFAASASTKGGDADAVDRQGVVNCARACLRHGVPRLVVVSSGTVTRPDAAVYQLLNFVGQGIMAAKIVGEDAVRELYADPDVRGAGLGYTVVRPGGLTTGSSRGVGALEINQGDSKSGRLARADVAAICVACLDFPGAFDTTFECYETNTAKPVEAVGLSNILKRTDGTEFRSGRERTGDTWGELFEGLSRDS